MYFLQFPKQTHYLKKSLEYAMLFGRKNRKPISIPVKKVKEWKYTTCNYCSTGCSIEIGLDENKKLVTSRGHAGADVNRGKLCIKGLLEQELFNSAGRGTDPLIRDKHYHNFEGTSWDHALDTTAEHIKKCESAPGRCARKKSPNAFEALKPV